MKSQSRKSNFEKKILYAILTLTIVFSALYLASYFGQHFLQNNPPASEPKAAIIDQLSFSNQTTNQTFVQTSIAILNAAGFEVTYYKGEDVTVEFYQKLPTLDYDLIIFRVHSAVRMDNPTLPYYVSFFTSEFYSQNKYVTQPDELLMGQLEENGPTYFAITPKFVENSMNGKFANTTIIMMGCDGLKYDNMADALVKKGAKVYISWNGTVTAAHSDATTSLLLQALLIEKQTIQHAIADTMNKIGPDPDSGSQLSYYPTESQNYIVKTE